MECLALPLRGFVEVSAAELAFPIRRPFLDRESQVTGRAEEVDVVGHDQVVAGQPGVGSSPVGFEGGLDAWICHPWNSVFGANCEEDNRWLV